MEGQVRRTLNSRRERKLFGRGSSGVAVGRVVAKWMVRLVVLVDLFPLSMA